MRPCELVSLQQPLCNWVPLAWKPHWRLKSPRQVKSIQKELTESELGKVKWVCYSPWLGLQFFAVLPVFQPSPDSGNSRESNGNSRESVEFPRSSSGVGNSTSLVKTRTKTLPNYQTPKKVLTCDVSTVHTHLMFSLCRNLLPSCRRVEVSAYSSTCLSIPRTSTLSTKRRVKIYTSCTAERSKAAY